MDPPRVAEIGARVATLGLVRPVSSLTQAIVVELADGLALGMHGGRAFRNVAVLRIGLPQDRHPETTSGSTAGYSSRVVDELRSTVTAAVLQTTSTPNTVARAGWPTAQRAAIAPPKTTALTASAPANGSRIRAFGAANKPQRTVAANGSPRPPRTWTTAPLPAVNPHQPNSASAHSSSRRASASFKTRTDLGIGTTTIHVGSTRSVAPTSPRCGRWPALAAYIKLDTACRPSRPLACVSACMPVSHWRPRKR
jgi:hypothetical protein